jgi:hypothetical protein
MTLDQIPATMTETIDDFFIDAARIITRDYLVSNGVLQILDRYYYFFSRSSLGTTI